MAGSPAPGIDFSTGSPVSLTNSGITFSHESGGSISDVNGNLLFYADGNSVIFNKNHVPMPNGTGIIMHNSVTQGCIFVPKPGSATIYYMFHIGVPNLGSPPFNLYYSEIDVTMSGGLGAVNANKNIPIATSFGDCSEKMSATKHCNGTDYWLLVHSWNGSTFRAYPVTAAGVGAPVISSVGTAHINNAGGSDAIGQMKISPNGAKVALVVMQSTFAELFDFNKNTGVVSNPINLGSLGLNPYGVEFSPDNSKLYASNGATPGVIKQWDLCAGSPAAIVASGFPLANDNVLSMQLASDGKIYGCKYSGTLSVINNPNVMGVGSNYVAAGFSVAPQNTGCGLPSFITSYFDTPANTPQATGTQVNSGSCGCVGSATADICTVFGSSPYVYSWSNGTTLGPTTALTSTISNLCPGTYSVIVSDAACKSDTLNFTITGGGNSFSVTPASTSASCGSSNGTGTVSVTGGTSPYTYLWNPTSQTSSAATGLAAGNYTVTIIDAAACTQTAVVNIPSAGGGIIAITAQNVICNGGNTGSANAIPSSGTAPFTYAWSNGQSSQVATGLVAGNYTCMVTDAAGCSSTQTISVTEPTPMTSSVFVSIASCGQSNAVATVLAGGGNSPYGYLWTNGQTTSSATALAAGNYTCVVTDAGGCTHSAIATIVNGNGPVPTISAQTSTSCNGGNNGTATASATGGTAPYTFVWSNGQTSQTASGLSSTVYIVTVTDAGGCTNTQTVSIAQPAMIVVNSTSTPAGCGLSNGLATAGASGGTGAYTYSWSNGQGSQIATGLAAGSYTVTVIDANGCTQTGVTTVGQSAGPTANAGADVTIMEGSATSLGASGGLIYAWSPSAGLNNPAIANPTASPTITTTYCVIVTDAGGCSDSACVTVYVVPEPIPCGEFYLPNAFSPNQDSENDEFKAYIPPSCVKEFKLKIFNRWGDKIFESDDVTKTWNGEYNGEPANAAVYTYFVHAELTNGDVIDRKGNISLVR